MGFGPITHRLIHNLLHIVDDPLLHTRQGAVSWVLFAFLVTPASFQESSCRAGKTKATAYAVYPALCSLGTECYFRQADQAETPA